MELGVKSISYRHGDVKLTGLLFACDALKRPGVLVVHGGAGLDGHAKDRAKTIAELGFGVFACDMYGNGVAGNRGRVMAQVTELRNDPARLCQRARTGLG